MEQAIPYHDVLLFLTKVQYWIDNKGLDVSIESDDGAVSRKEPTEANVVAYKTLDLFC